MAKHTDILIVGGGMAGLSMAIALVRQGLHVTVVEKTTFDAQHMPAFDGRVSAISLGSKRMLDRLGVWEHMQAHAEPILDIRVSDGSSPFFLHYDHQEVGASSSSAVTGKRNSEPFGWIVENRHTRRALYEIVSANKNIQVVLGTPKALEQQDNKASITLDNGSHITAKLIIAADGKFSTLREMAGIAVHQQRYQQTALVCTIRHSKPHHGLAQERFLARGPFAVLPMQENQSSLVWVEPETQAPHYIALNNTELEQEIQERLEGYLGDVEVVGKLFSYPLSISLAESFHTGRVALIGDAAHAIHPIAGQGINLGFRDVAVLAEVIKQQQSLRNDIGGVSVMQAYGKWRRLDTLSMAVVTHGLNQLFLTRAFPVKLARGAGLWAVGKLPKLKQVFMRHAMGISGDMPELMR